MMIRFTCDQCGHVYALGDAYAGKKVRCGQCQKVLEVPAAGSQAQPVNPIRYAADGITPDFSEFFMAMLKHEREAPPLEMSHR
ncbi:MAG: hypothetical protein JXB18_00585 [Sedimentisphaerales bacterium]|nr:hypothetical protein [Sedimentisphaerales bacterium]